MLFQSNPDQWHAALLLLITEKFTERAEQEATAGKEQRVQSSHPHPAGAGARATLLQNFQILLIES